jgi:sugar phosphate isomerase/epimerase
MPTRRTFLRCGAASVVASLAATRPALAAMRRKQLKQIGIQLYTVRNQMASDFQGTLELIAKLGYKEVEFAGYFDRTPQQVKETLAAIGLAAPSAHVPLNVIRSDWPKALETAKAIGHKYLVLAWLAPEERTSIDQYGKLAELLNSAGQAARSQGIQLAYHNHDFEFVKIDGVVPYDLLLEKTDPKNVQIELDLYWTAKAGADPFQYFAKYPGRFPLVHVKDMDSTEKKFFTEVGKGTIDFAKIFAKSGQAGIKHYFVEQDQTPGSPFDSIKISIDYLRKLQF